MQHEHKKWKRKFLGNKRLLNKVKNPLRAYIEDQIKKISVKQFINRPAVPVDLSIGDPTNSAQFKTNPQNIEIIKKNVGKIDGYTKFVGADEARQSIASMFQSPHYKIDKQNVFLTAGGSIAIWSTIMLLANQGDNFLFPSPSFPLAGVIADSIGLQMRFYHLKSQEDWKADINQMNSLIDDRTKFIYVNDPSNPLGSCWPDQHKKQIIELAKKHKIPLLVDEIYQGVTYGQPSKTFAQLSSEQITIFKCSGLTKRWLGPGWRLGWLIIYASQQNLSKYSTPLKNIFNIILMPHTIMQSSVKQILENPSNDGYISQRMKLMKKNQQLLSQRLKHEPYCSVGTASGALYATVILKMNKLDQEKIPNIIQFCKMLYAQQNVMVFPGKFFNSTQDFIRLIICCSLSLIQQFLTRFIRFCRRYIKNE